MTRAKFNPIYFNSIQFNSIQSNAINRVRVENASKISISYAEWVQPMVNEIEDHAFRKIKHGNPEGIGINL